MPRYLLPLLFAALLSACASLDGPAFTVGSTTQAEVVARRGTPAMHWQEPDGGNLFAYPSGPNGTSTIMAGFDKQQRLSFYKEVLNVEHFSQIQAGMSMDEVMRLIGPPYAPWTAYFSARDELAWEWRYCNDWNQASRFNVLFDGTSKKVRSTLSLTESQVFGYRSNPPCGHVYIKLGPAAFGSR